MNATQSPEVVEQVTIAWHFIAGLAPLPVLFVGWLKYRENRWRFSARRSKAFRKLLVNDQWQYAASFELQFAMQDAFGRSIPRAGLAFIGTRLNAIRLLRDRLSAGRTATFKAEATGWHMPKADKGGEAVLKRRLLFLYTLGWIVAGIALSALTYFVLAPKVSLALVFLYGALFSMMFFAIAVQTEAARRLVTLTNYPPLDEIPAHLKTEHPKSVKGASKPRSRPKAVPKEGGGGTLPDVGK